MEDVYAKYRKKEDVNISVIKPQGSFEEGVAKVANWIRKTPGQQTIADVGSGISQTASRVPEAAANLLKMGAQSGTIAFGEHYKPKSSLAKGLVKFSDDVIKMSKGQQQLISEVTQNKTVSAVSQGATSLLMSAGMGVIAGTAKAAGMLAAYESLPEYTNALNAGASERKALITAAASGAGTYITEKIGLDFMFKNLGGKFVSNSIGTQIARRVTTGIIGGTSEAVQETIQNAWQNLVKKTSYDKTQKLFENWAQTAVISFGLGAITGGLGANIQAKKGVDVQDLADAVDMYEEARTVDENSFKSMQKELGYSRSQALDLFNDLGDFATNTKNELSNSISKNNIATPKSPNEISNDLEYLKGRLSPEEYKKAEAIYKEAEAQYKKKNGQTVKVNPIKVNTKLKGTHINVGLNVNDGSKLTEKGIADILKKEFGVTIKNQSTQQSDSEATLVAELSRELTPDELYRLAELTKQDAIPQLSNGIGIMAGLNVEAWGTDFNPEYFMDINGKSVIDATPGVTPVATDSEFVVNTPAIMKESEYARKLRAIFIEKGLTEVGMSELPDFEGKTLKGQSEIISDLIGTDIEAAKRMVQGLQEIPMGISEVALIKSLEMEAGRTGDIELADMLISRKPSKTISLAGQELGMARIGDSDTFVGALRSIKRAKKRGIVDKAKIEKSKDAIKKADQQVTKRKERIKKASKDSWDSFITDVEETLNEITCKT